MNKWPSSKYDPKPLKPFTAASSTSTYFREENTIMIKIDAAVVMFEF